MCAWGWSQRSHSARGNNVDSRLWFDKLMERCEEVRSQRVGTCDVCAALSGDAKSSNTDSNSADSAGRAECASLSH